MNWTHVKILLPCSPLGEKDQIMMITSKPPYSHIIKFLFVPKGPMPQNSFFDHDKESLITRVLN